MKALFRHCCYMLLTIMLMMPAAIAAAQQDQSSPSTSDFNLPQIGEAGGSVITPQQEYEIGLQIMDQLQHAGAMINDPQIHEYIDNLGHILSSHSDNPTLHFEYFVLDDPEINAVTLPGGFIGVNSGMILASDDEDELAGVMAHETGHVTQRHIARQIEDQQDRSLLNLATLLGAILVATQSSDPNVAMGTLMTAQGEMIQHQINFTRSQEEEADRVGIQTLARAGFPPTGMIDFFEKLQRSSTLNGYDQIPEFLMDHPLDSTRMAYLRERAQKMHVPPRPDSRSYSLMKARLRVLVSNSADHTQKFFRAGVGSEHGWHKVAMEYGLSLIDTRLNDDSEAIRLMQGLEKQFPDVVAFHIGLAEAEMGADRIKQAITTYRIAMKIFPDSRPLILSYASDMIDADKPEAAITTLLGLSDVSSDGNGEVLRLLAKAYDKAGNSADSHFYMSRYYSMTGLDDQALQQLRIALAVPNISNYQRQRYQASLERIKTKLLAEHKGHSHDNDASFRIR